MFKHNLNNIKTHIKRAEKSDLFNLVENRLNKTFNLYVQELQENYDRLLKHRDIHVLKRVVKGGDE